VPRIRIINPNTTAAFSAACLAAGRAVAAPGTELLAGQPTRGTPSVECHVDEAIATLGVIEAVHAGERNGADGYVIACFGDTGLEAAREVTAAPVVGMTEAALYTAAMIAPVFSIVTLPRRTRVFAQRSVSHAGLRERCVGIRAIDVGVLDCEEEADVVYEPFVIEAQHAIIQDHAEAIILGCAGLQPLLGRLEATLGVPVIEGVAAAVKMVEALLALGLKTSKRGAWGFPAQKVITGPAADLLRSR
jgi:allantoin racemase